MTDHIPTAVDVKDRMLISLVSADNPQALASVAGSILFNLESNDGLWVSAGYGYKAAEICNRIVNEIGFYQNVEMSQELREEFTSIQTKASEMATSFRKYHNAKRHPHYLVNGF